MTSPQHFDAVIVGSGFGGSVTAARLAEAGWSVCLLERGKAYPPNSFPRSPLGMKHNFWHPSEGLHGMFDLWSFTGLDAVCASGLGGGSLIYANVFLRKDEKWFVHDDRSGGGYENWPVTRADLDPHYDRVQQRIGLQHFPLQDPPYDATPKVIAFRDAAQRAGLDWALVPLAVTFANEGRPPAPGQPINESVPNIHGGARETCRLCGECDVGCNYGAKNTLDYTYITHAWHAGADIRTRSEVREFEPRDGGGYAVRYVVHPPEAEGRPTETAGLQPATVTCEHLVLAAGTLGTTWLMLRNRSALGGLSDQLGLGFSGNGDLLTFALRCRSDGGPRVIEPGSGPVITSAVRIPDGVEGGDGRGFYVEDAGFPQFAGWMLQLLQQPRAIAEEVPHALRDWWSEHHGHRVSEIGDFASALLGDCELSSGLLPLLGMGRDIPDGKMHLQDGLLEVDWSKEGASARYYDRVRDISRRLSDELGGRFVDDPIWLENRVVTVHALGGCRMGRSEHEGVVDAHGRVFNCPGLHIADGSVMPGPVGANPSFTIAALADRFADAILDGPRKVSSVTRAVPPSPGAAPGPSGAHAVTPAASLSFTEEMKGYVTFGENDYDRGYRTGRDSGTALMFHLTIIAADVDRFIADPLHEGRAEGWIESDAFGGRLPVAKGVFNLFVDERPPGFKRMLYRLQFADGAQHPLTLTGFKEIRRHHGLDLWTETTTLFTRVLAGDVEPSADGSAEIVAGGILHIHPLDFAKQLTTFRVEPPSQVGALARFGALFAGELWEAYRP